MPTIDHLPGRTLHVDGREYLFCSGTSYLGMARNEAFAELLCEGISHYGTNYSSSRHSNLRLAVFEEAEQLLAQQTGTAAVLTVSSGYLAGQMAVRALANAGRFVYAPGTHPAAWLTDDHATAPALPYHTWSTLLLEELASTPPEPLVIVTNSLDPLRVERYEFSWALQLPTNRPITLLIDDSHGFGVIGRDGAGIISELQVPPSVRLVVVSSLGKACGIPGGVVFSSDVAFIEQLRRSGFFGASSPVVPAYLYAFVRATKLYQQARQQLGANMRQFADAVQPLRLFQYAPDFPVFYTPANELCPFLEERNVLISSFTYPTPTDPCITRVVLSALHTPADVARVAELCTAFSTQA